MRRDQLADAAEAYIDAAVTAAGAPPMLSGAGPDAIIAKARGRFLGVGAEQYQISETEQSFERSTVGTMLVGLIEELVDHVNYAVMTDILAGRRLDAIVGDGVDPGSAYGALYDLRRDLRESAYMALCSAVLMDAHVERLVALGEYERRAEADYASQLAAECEAADAPALDPETPEGLDAIAAEFALAARQWRDDGGAR